MKYLKCFESLQQTCFEITKVEYDKLRDKNVDEIEYEIPINNLYNIIKKQTDILFESKNCTFSQINKQRQIDLTYTIPVENKKPIEVNITMWEIYDLWFLGYVLVYNKGEHFYFKCDQEHGLKNFAKELGPIINEIIDNVYL